MSVSFAAIDSGPARAASPSLPATALEEIPLSPSDGIDSDRGAAVALSRSAAVEPGARGARGHGQRPVSSEMATLQRARLIVAVVEVVEEVGYAQLTVSKIISRARVSRKTFYDVFANREDCFLAVFEQAAGRARSVAAGAYAGEDGWRKGMRAALEAVLVLMDEEPGLARLCVVEALGAGPRVLDSRTQLLRELARALDRARDESVGLRNPPAITAEAVAGGIASVLHSRLCKRRRAPLSDLLGSLMSMIVLPYLGARAAGQELSKQSSVRARRKERPIPPAEADPLQGLSIRLTYRTVRTLLAIAECPGASNRSVGEVAGVADQGQISKLLNRLSDLELIENHGPGQAKGGPNAWLLTDRGERLFQVAWSR